MLKVVFFLSLLAILSLVILCVPGLFSDRYRFFPPPEPGTWQDKLFWVLFRSFVFGLIVLSYLEFNSSRGKISLILGFVLLLIGIGTACYLSYVTLGKMNSYGGKGGLRKEGLYLWSRNPVYVATLVGMVGWGIFIGSWYVGVLLIVWSVVYLIAPFIEERWLAQTYGDAYLEYKSQVSRFFGPPKNINMK